VEFIKAWPECGAELVRGEDEAAHYCTNEDGCPTQRMGKIEHFVCRKAMNINIGSENIDLFYKKGLISNSADLYELKLEDLMHLERWGLKSAQNLIKSIEDSKLVPFERVLFALGIRYVGATVAKKLAQGLESIERIENATYDDLVSVDEIGEIIANSVIRFFKKEENREFVNRLKAYGLKFEMSNDKVEQMGDALQGLSVIISGTFERHSRDELKVLIEQYGGKNVTSISSKTDYLLAGANIGPSKLDKAKKLNIKFLSEEEFEQMIGEK